MSIDTLHLIRFSPTRTTERILDRIAQGLRPSKVTHIDLTSAESDKMAPVFLDTGVAMIGVPVYAGRVPPTCVARLEKIKAEGVPVILVVVYGNRAYEDALLELKNRADNLGFCPVAGSAFIGEHSYSTQEKPIAANRPDAEDLANAEAFGRDVARHLTDETRGTLTVPGNTPYRDFPDPPGLAPHTQHEQCVLCGHCLTLCPTACLRIETRLETDPANCILCHACVKGCPEAARTVEIPRVQQISNWLYENCQERKTPEYYFRTTGKQSRTA